ncbi:UV DNA damage repair endonuclease UvsE [Bacillus carboniphilus]|uniref:UV DNA damage repair endonuclease UvsE n=1 Tax=Bacillus carboniphilus TaxID=86663 RepID=A0ABY9JSF4_9BACI|nr:UV DNA damage repair endonuclease UvsE [Bacillus carboniphilus]WLR41744.1 UV DNA damage repair endonuclease UvsE [Bacillus carboniphilus]
MKLGYACINTTLPTKFRTCRLKTIQTEGFQKIKELALHNLQQVVSALNWNVEHGILFYRLSSDLIPFASHPITNEWKWYEDDDLLEVTEEIRAIRKKHGLRLSCHPGQYTILNSKREEVVANATLDLQYHSHLMDLVDGEDIILHVGGAYGDKESSKKRLVHAYEKLEEKIKKRLRFENDHHTFHAKDLVDIYEMSGASICFDIHHHNCNPAPENITTLLPIIFSSWTNTPKVHISSGQKSKTDPSHHNYILEKDFIEFMNLLGDQPIDMMFEAKKKEQSVLRVMDWSKQHRPSIYEKIEKG